MEQVKSSFGDHTMKFTVLGARGSAPVGGEGFNKYGGNTSCYMIECGKEQIFLDAGTGIMKAPYNKDANITVLLTHLHIDHLIGFPFFRPLFDREKRVKIYSVKRENGLLKDQLNGLFKPPFWPLRIDEYRANIDYIEPVFPFMIGDVKVEGIEGNHPGGCTIYKLTRNGKVIVCMTDYEHTSDGFPQDLIDFVKGADILLYDAQYRNDDYEAHKGFGHSTPEKGLEFKRITSVKNMFFVHHDPYYDDDMLDSLEAALDDPNVHYAKYKDVILL